jgi:hypothetical protein
MSIKHATAEPGQAHERKALEALKAEDPAWHVVGHDGKNQLVYGHPVYGRVTIPNSPRSKGDAIQATVQKARKKRRQAEGHLGAVLQMLRSEFDVPDDGYVDAKFNVSERVRKYIAERPDKHHISAHALLQQVTSSGITLIDRKQGIRRIPGKNYTADGSDDKGTPQGTVQPDAEKADGRHAVTSTKAYLLPEVQTPWVREFLRSKHPELGGNVRLQAHFEAQTPDRLDEIVKAFRADHPTMSPTYVADYLGVRVHSVLASIDRLRELEKVEARQRDDEDHRIRIEVAPVEPPKPLAQIDRESEAQPDPETPPVPLADHLDAATAEAVAELNEPGVGVVIPAEVVGPLRGYFTGDLEAKLAAANDRIMDLEQRLTYAVEQLDSIRMAAAEAAGLTKD